MTAPAPALDIQVLVLGAFETNCWIVSDRERRALVIDPSFEPERILSHLDQHRLEVLAYLCTHGHVDHVSALAALRRARPAPAGMHPADAVWAFTAVNSFPPLVPVPADPGPLERELVEDSTWQDGGCCYRVLATPGHTPGGVCLHFEAERILFTGDTLFAGGMGRTDLPGGDGRRLLASLARLGGLDGDITVLPGHGPSSTIAREREGTIRWAGGML